MSSDEKQKAGVTGAYLCPLREGGTKFTLWGLVKELEEKPDFAEFFATQLRLANMGDGKAIECVESYYEPTDEELANLGLHESQWGSMRRCTDSGLLVIVIARQTAPAVFKNR